MCLPIGCLKLTVGLSCLLTLALGVIAIVCGAMLGKNEVFVDDVQNSKKAIMGVTIAFGVLLMILALFGFIGTWRKSSLCLTLYNIGIAIFFVIFLAIAIAAFVVFKKYNSDNIQTINLCKDQSWLQTLDNYAVDANKLLCSADCRCEVTTATTWIVSNASLSWTVVGNGPVRVQDCPNYSSSSNVDVMKYLEENYNCAGVCTTSTYYVFSDVNRGMPTDECAQKLMDTLLTYSKQIGAVTIVIAIALLLVMVFSCCLCCHPQKKNEFESSQSKNN